MNAIPRTDIGGLSVSRLAVGTNTFVGVSHTTKSRDNFFHELMSRKHVADIIEVFMRAGVNLVFGGRVDTTHVTEAIKDAEDRVGEKCYRVCTPSFIIKDEAEGLDNAARAFDAYAEMGCHICMPHQNSLDPLIDYRNRRFMGTEKHMALIRERGMLPGFSTHTPVAPKIADECGLDVETYVQIYNAAGFLMQIEVDWVHRMIWNLKKPVLTIKPLAAGRLHPLVGLSFSWATLRPRDVITVGAMTADEAKEIIDISLAVLEKRAPTAPLQSSRSKQTIDKNVAGWK